MEQETPEPLRWEDWDWRPLARFIVWLALTAAWARGQGLLSAQTLHAVFRELLLGWLLSFGLLTYVQALVATSALRLALAADDLAYALSERLTRIFLARASFAATFLIAFALELALVLLSARTVAGALR